MKIFYSSCAAVILCAALSNSVYAQDADTTTVIPRKVVVEEATGTWCGYCPRGIVGMNAMRQNHPDSFIGIAVHDDSDMYSDSYHDFVYCFSGLPSCAVDRYYATDPNADDLEYIYGLEIDQAVAEVHISATWADADQTSLRIHAESSFAQDFLDSCTLIYAVVEDSVGPYVQTNYYSGSTDEMGGFESLDWYTPVIFNDVARYISGPTWQGAYGPLPTPALAGETYICDSLLQVPTNVANLQNARFIVLLVHTGNGINILNADEVTYAEVGAYDASATTAITLASAQAEVFRPVVVGHGLIGNLPKGQIATVYNLQGQVLTTGRVNDSGRLTLGSNAPAVVLVSCGGRAVKVLMK